MDFKEVAKHKSSNSCWVVLYGNVYDVTEFLPNHPGGSKIILQLAGTDATEEYDPIHPPGTIEENLRPQAKLGQVDPKTVPKKKNPVGKPTNSEPPRLDTLLNIDDIEQAATSLISGKAWAYYYSAADDLISKSLNNTVYRSILLRPRVFVDCRKCETTTTILGGMKMSVPIFVSPAAQARLVHPDGEHALAQACANYETIQIISHNASLTPEQIVEGAPADQIFGWQIYVQNDRKKSEATLARIKKISQIKFIVLTLDAPVPGKREHDERMGNINNGPEQGVLQTPGGVGAALFSGTAADLTWKTTLPWLAEHTKLPIVLKGLQTHEDAYIASLHTPQVRGIILSNHGGRAVDTAPPSIHTLMEIRKYCPEVLAKLDVMVDGGIKRGTDVVKALCLGAKAVGIGRPPLFGLGVGGKEGVERVFQILKAETKTCMRLLGVSSVDQLGLKHINARALEREIYDGPAAFERLGLWVKQKL